MHIDAPASAKALASSILRQQKPVMFRLYWISAVMATASSIVAALSLFLSS